MNNEPKITANTIICTMAIKACAKLGYFEKAMKIYVYMGNNPKAQPNKFTYNALLDCCYKCNEVDTAISLYSKMKKSFEPDIITYSIVANIYSSQGNSTADLNKAFALIEEMKTQSIIPDEIFFNSILEGCFKFKQPEVALRVYNYMQSIQLPLSNTTYSILSKIYT